MRWENTPGSSTCEECRDDYERDDKEPPCDTTCWHPQFLYPENELPIMLWKYCAFHSRPLGGMGSTMPIPISEIKAICEVYDTDRSIFEKIIKIEQVVFPMLQEQQKIESEKKGNK